MMDGQIYFLIVAPWLILPFYQQKAKLAGIGANRKVFISGSMCVIPTSSGRLGRETIAMGFTNRNHWRSFFHSAIVLNVYRQTVPMNNVLFRRPIRDIDRNRHT